MDGPLSAAGHRRLSLARVQRPDDASHGCVFQGCDPTLWNVRCGAPGSAIYVLLGLLWGYSAWALYKLDRRGWWIAFGSMVIFCVSTSITYSLHSVREIYVLMGTPETQIAQIEKFGLFEGHRGIWMTLLARRPFLAI